MWYDMTVSSLSSWLEDVMELFNDTFYALMAEPVFQFLFGVLAFLALAGLFLYILWRSRKF